MAANRKDKNGWVAGIAASLEPTLSAHGFAKVSGAKFHRDRKPSPKDRYLLSARHPRHGDDPHEIYVDPCIHVVFPEVEAVAARLSGKPWNKDFPTIGGSLGLFTPADSIQEWPIDSEEDARNVVPNLLKDIEEVAIPFWNFFSTRSALLEAVETEHPWARVPAYWRFHHLALVCIERGRDAAIEFLETQSKGFRGSQDRIQAVLMDPGCCQSD